MKRIIGKLLIVCSLVLASCDRAGNVQVSSQGPAYEVLLVASNQIWQSELRDTLMSELQRPVEYIADLEPWFSVMRISPNLFEGLRQRHRNILFVRVGEEYETSALTFKENVYAAPQVIGTISGPDIVSVTDFVHTNGDYIRALYDVTERERYVAQSRKFQEQMITRQIQEKFGFELPLSKGFRVRNSMDDFMWISFEYPLASQGVVIYSYPSQGRESFSMDSLLVNRNRFVSRIPAENEGSYMSTTPEFDPVVSYERIRGRLWAIMRGYWETEGDWMGGPFISFSTLDTETSRVVTIDCYLYSPERDKRNMLRQLESLVYAVRFPGDEAILKEMEEAREE